MASRSYRAEAIVLKTHDFGEADRILTLLTRHFGKVRVVAKGIRKPLARLAGTPSRSRTPPTSSRAGGTSTS